MPRTLLTGATGTLGTALRPRLAEAGHEVVAASRSPPAGGAADAVEWVELDLASGRGLESAIADAEVVVHAASAPQGDSDAVDVVGTKRLLAAAEDAEVANVCYVSIVGVEEIPYSYYEHKLAAERAIEDSEVPSTIVRATQFHEFVAEMLEMVGKLPVWPLPTKFRLQPIAAAEAAEAVVDHASPAPGGRVPVVGGPEVRTVGELATTYRESLGCRRPIVRLPLPGGVASGFRAGEATCPDRAVGETTWEQWLETAEQTAGTTTDDAAQAGR
ncbi:SDR family oxidoreductase [Halobacteriales archaeon Cl-PHB]